MRNINAWALTLFNSRTSYFHVPIILLSLVGMPTRDQNMDTLKTKKNIFIAGDTTWRPCTNNASLYIFFIFYAQNHLLALNFG